MGFVKEIPELFKHQGVTVDYHMDNDRVYDASDPGTGKTRSALEMISRRQKAGAGKALVFAPKSILVPSWAIDLRTFTPHLKYVVATATNRKKAFNQDVDVYITNTDAAKWIEKNVDLDDFDILISDEHTAYKHRTSARAKSMAKIAKHFQYRVGMSGTPNPNGVLDLWHQYYILDDGDHLGTNFWQFRMKVCEPEQTGPGAEMVKWVDRPGAAEAVADILSDMTIRHKMEDCISIPEHTIRTVNFDLSAKHLKAYKDLEADAIIQLKDTTVSAVHKGALRTKLLQLASGAVYDSEGYAAVASTDRYELVMELAEERESCVVAFSWKHQRDQLLELAKKKGISHALIDGSVKDLDRQKAVKDFQSGKIKILFAHPMSAAHGLTLTKGTTTIWPGPIDDAERFQQFNRRIYRAGQTRKTETIMVAGNDTLEAGVYDRLNGKVSDMVDLLSILTAPVDLVA
jgi:SNF2 family DNA or RNA helicase